MTVCWFALFRTERSDVQVSDGEIAWLTKLIAATPSLSDARIYTAGSTIDPYLDDGPPPRLALQLYFDDIAALEATLWRDGHLQALVGQDALPSLRGADVTQQAMLVRRFPVPEATFRTPQGELPCTYLVAYEGEAVDLNAWNAFYLTDHPPIMARFPGIREIEVCTCIDWCGFLPWQRVEHMQRNKVVFDSASALTVALSSPVRHEMRAGFRNFPPFTGPISHYPMLTRRIEPRR
jgi:hypothetical protein